MCFPTLSRPCPPHPPPGEDRIFACLLGVGWARGEYRRGIAGGVCVMGGEERRTRKTFWKIPYTFAHIFCSPGNPPPRRSPRPWVVVLARSLPLRGGIKAVPGPGPSRISRRGAPRRGSCTPQPPPHGFESTKGQTTGAPGVGGAAGCLSARLSDPLFP